MTWTSNDPLVATVDAQGAITGVALGSTNVEARIDSLTHSFSVNVTASGVAMGQSMVGARQAHSATKLANGKVLVAGGETEPTATTAEIYDPRPRPGPPREIWPTRTVTTRRLCCPTGECLRRVEWVQDRRFHTPKSTIP